MTGTFTLVASGVPTGGAVLLTISDTPSAGYTGLTLNRSADGGSTWTPIYSGGPTSLFLDVGDGTNTFLATGTSYLYKVQDITTPSVSALSNAVVPSSQITVFQDVTVESFRRLFQCAVQSLVVPAGYKNPQFLVQMPLDSTPELPFVTMNLDLAQMEDVPIGFSVPLENFTSEALSPSGATSVWTVQCLERRRYSIYVLTRTYTERDYLEAAVIGTFFGLQSALAAINTNVRVGYQAAQGAVEGHENQPGFYYSQIAFDTTHVAMTKISALTGIISAMTVTANSGAGNATATAGSAGLFVST